MTLTYKEFREADRIMAKALDCDLSAWDEQFVNDMTDRLGEYGEGTYISRRQWAEIHRIEERYL